MLARYNSAYSFWLQQVLAVLNGKKQDILEHAALVTKFTTS